MGRGQDNVTDFQALDRPVSELRHTASPTCSKTGPENPWHHFHRKTSAYLQNVSLKPNSTHAIPGNVGWC